MAKESNIVLMSEAMTEAVATYAQEHDMSKSELMRTAIAQYIDYDLDADPKVERTRKYANKAERDRAQRNRAKAKRQTTAELMRAIKAGRTNDDILAIARSLLGKSETADAIIANAEDN